MKRLVVIASLIALTLIAVASGNAAEKRKSGGVAGIVKSVDVEARKVILEKDGQESTVILQKGCQIFRGETADESAVKDGVHVQADGTVNEDQTAMQLRQLTVYIPKGRGFDLLSEKRVDGKLSVRDGKWVVSAKGKEVELQKGEKTRIVTRTWVEASDIPTETSASCWGYKTDTGAEAGMFYFTAK